MIGRLVIVAAIIAATTTDAYKVHIKIHRKHHDHNSTTTTTEENVNATSWQFQPVTTIQARISSGPPVWDADKETYVGAFGATFEDRYMSILDTVNTASVEGVLKYAQSECINVKEQSTPCVRKNSAQFVWFMEITTVQPTPSVAYYGQGPTAHPTLEYGPFAAMDGGACTPHGDVLPEQCKQFVGLDGQPTVGMYVGSNQQDMDPRAPYPNTYWFSYPSSCPFTTWKEKKSTSCRTRYSGGQCPFGTTPDGIYCSFSVQVLGYVNLDELVGITSGDALPEAHTKYPSYKEFCEAGHVEFTATNDNGFQNVTSIPFWKDPGDPQANAARTQQLIELYETLVETPAVDQNGTFTALKTPETLTKSNPPCYQNAPTCATATYGCRRTLYAQLCEVCTSASSDCVTAPASFKFPILAVPTPSISKSSSASGSSSSSQDAGTIRKKEESNTPNRISNSATMMVTSTVVVIVSAMTMVWL